MNGITVDFKKHSGRTFLFVCVLLLFSTQTLAAMGTPNRENSAAQTTYSPPPPPNCPANSIFRWTLIGTPPSINPNTIVTNTAGFILDGLEYTGTETYDPYGNVNNASFFLSSIHHNANYTQWVFNVKPDIKWSDGEPITAADIIATANLSASPAYDYAGIGLYLTRMYAPNATTAIFDLNTSDAWLPLQLTDDGIPGVNTMPASVVAQIYPSGSNLGTNIANGPFYLSNFHSGDLTATMYRNPNFYPQPKICEIQINFVESLSLGAERLESGSSDLAFISPTDAAAVSRVPNLHVLDEKGIGIATLEYNDSIYPYNNTAFRQALAYGINESEYVSQALNGYGLTAYDAQGIVTPTAARWYDPNQPKYSYDPNQSLSLLSTVGITKGSDNLLHYSNGTVATLTIWTDTGNSEDLIAASTVQKDLQALGFNVNLQATSTSNIVGDYTGNLNGKSAMILFSSAVFNPGVGVVDSYPGWALYWAPPVANPYWLFPPSANNQYLSNYTAMQATDNFTLDQQYLNAIQNLNAKYLPTIVLAYPDELYGYSTQYWSNWPTGYWDEGVNSTPNFTAWYSLIPSTNSGASSTTAVSTPTSSLSSTSSAATSSSSAQTTSSSSSSLTSLTPLGAMTIASIVLTTLGVVVISRRRRLA